jgi:hypothetical protein
VGKEERDGGRYMTGDRIFRDMGVGWGVRA